MKPSKYKQLPEYKEPRWYCEYNINEYWEYIKYAITGETNKLVILK